MPQFDFQGYASPSEGVGLGTASHRYFDRTFQAEAIKIAPGEYFATPEQLMLVTLLGSCVSACIRDPERKIGGLNHFLLPHAAEQDKFAAARYGNFAMELLINSLLKLGARRGALVAKVFGGANVVRLMKNSRVGSSNSEFVLEYLEREGIRVLAADLGGVQPRRVHYFPHTGQVMLRVLPFTEAQAVQRAEEALEDQAAHTEGDVELFS